MRVKLIGADGQGWSTASDQSYTAKFILDLGHKIVSNPIVANLIHCVWYNALESKRYFYKRFKYTIAVATNDLEHNRDRFLKQTDYVNVWIAASKKQLDYIESHGLNVEYQPFYVDEEVFRPKQDQKAKICKKYGVNYKAIEKSFVLGSFQRDSLGTDLNKPKWQKNPDLLIEIVRNLKRKIQPLVLLLAGPRRHYVIEQCVKYKIPYIFVGEYPQLHIDDYPENILNKNVISDLYNLLDCYIVSSKSEGGPKSVIESSFTKTFIISTDVGLSKDFLDPSVIYKNSSDAIKIITRMYRNPEYNFQIIENNYKNALDIGSYNPTLARWNKIYSSISL